MDMDPPIHRNKDGHTYAHRHIGMHMVTLCIHRCTGTHMGTWAHRTHMLAHTYMGTRYHVVTYIHTWHKGTHLGTCAHSRHTCIYKHTGAHMHNGHIRAHMGT